MIQSAKFGLIFLSCWCYGAKRHQFVSSNVRENHEMMEENSISIIKPTDTRLDKWYLAEIPWVWLKYSLLRGLGGFQTFSPPRQWVFGTHAVGFQWPNIQGYSSVSGFYGLYHDQSWILSLRVVFDHWSGIQDFSNTPLIKGGIWPWEWYLAPGVVFYSWLWYLTFESGIWPETFICMSEIWHWEWYKWGNIHLHFDVATPYKWNNAPLL